MNLAQLLQDQAELRPDAPAIVDVRRGVDRVTTFRRLAEASARTAAQLSAGGIGAGDGVLLLVPMSAETYVVLIALFRLGACAVILDPSAGTRQADLGCALAQPRGLIATLPASLLRLVCRAMDRIPKRFCLGAGWPFGQRLDPWGGTGHGASERPLIPPKDLPPDAPALLTFTSGSTGPPKLVLRSHDFLLAQHRALARALRLEAGQVDLTTLPVFVLANLAAGVTSVIPGVSLRRPDSIDPGPVLSQIQRWKVTRMAASPALLERLAGSAGDPGVASTVRQIYAGGGPVFPSLLLRFRERWPSGQVHVVYGSSEAEPIAHVAEAEIGKDDYLAMQNGGGLLVGRPVKEIKLAVLGKSWAQPLDVHRESVPQAAWWGERPREPDCEYANPGTPTSGRTDGSSGASPHRTHRFMVPLGNKQLDVEALSESAFEAMVAAPGERGEIVVSGPHVVQGYVGGRGDAKAKFRVGREVWHRTGDAGYCDGQGRLWLVGRCAARLQDGRGELYPFTVECAASSAGWVRRAGCVGVAGQRWLALEVHRTPAEKELAELAQTLAWAELAGIKILRTLPVDSRHNAKVDYSELGRLLADKI